MSNRGYYAFGIVELVSGVAGSAVAIGCVVGGTLGIDLGADQCLEIIVEAFIALFASRFIGSYFTVRVLWVEDDARTAIVLRNSKARVALDANPIRCKVFAVIIDAFAFSVLVDEHSGDALVAPAGSDIKMQAVSVSLNLLDTVDCRLT